MPLPEKILKADDNRRKDVGLVYNDDTLSAGPAAHVLVIGVAAYRSSQYKRLLQTATISARAVADWFVDGAKARFTNPDCRLGSVAVLLSETAGADKAVYAGGEIPRATFAAVDAAVRAWVARINTHKNNLAMLYVASHGESFLNRTAFLLEDYGMDAFNVTAGMVEVEQLVSALENTTPVAQLFLFDCCRNPTATALPWNESLGNKMISLTRSPDDHGEPRKQWVICSTSLGQYAAGFATGPTLFNNALMEALNGVASDTSTDGWPVRPGLLIDKVDRILALHRLPDEKAQTPGGRMAGSFDITFPGECQDVPIYITLSDPAEWPESVIKVTIDGAPADPIQGAEGESPFHVRRVPERAVVEVEASRRNVSLGRTTAKVRPPAVFMAIDKAAAALTTDVGRLAPSRTLVAKAKLIIAVEGQRPISKGAVASIVPQDKPRATARQVTVDIGGQTAVDMEPGELEITLRTADGRTQTRDITLAPGQILRVQFATEPSPHPWMSAGPIIGAITESAAASAGGLESAARASIDVEFVGSINMDLAITSLPEAGMRIVPGPDDGRYARYDVRDDVVTRFAKQQSPAPPMAFARVTGGQRVELAVIPSLGRAGPEMVGWTPFLLVDRHAALNEPATAVTVNDPRWTGLLGFLASREIAAATVLLDSGLSEAALLGSGLSEAAVDAMAEKVSNPLAAIAGALIAVAASNPDIEKTWDPWLENIAKWFVNIPDGPIVLGRRLLMRARTGEQIAKAGKWLVEGYRRGIPFYSLSIDWLARGLESLPDDYAGIATMRKAARQLSGRIDPTHAFTVIRAKDGAP